jgi:hypothetical protein
MSIAKKIFGLKTCQPIHMEDATMLFDKGLCGAVEDIVVGGGLFFGTFNRGYLPYLLRLGVGVGLGSRGNLVCFCGFQLSVGYCKIIY